MISSAIVETQNVYEDLFVTARNTNVDPNDVGVKILQVITEYKIGKDSEFQYIDDLSIFNDDSFFINPELHIRQSYKVEYFDKTLMPTVKIPRIVIGANRNFTRVVANFYATSGVRYNDELSMTLLNEIRVQLTKHGILVGMRDDEMHQAISKITSVIRVNDSFDKNMRFDIASGINQIPSVNDNYLYPYLNLDKDKDKDIDNTMNKNFLKPIKKGQTIIEYVKPRLGVYGRNLKGELLNITEPKRTHKIEPVISKNIRKTENEDKILYISKKDGYVVIEGNVYDVKAELDISQATIKTTGSIEAGIDSGVQINIQEQDSLKDAVGANIHINTSIVNIKGNIAQSATVTAKQVTIGGQTHAKSTVTAKKADISVHYGMLECEEGKIGRLENGKVKAKKIYIERALGGIITGEEVYIKNLYSNSTIMASKLIQVENVRGTNNRFIIDIASIPENEKKFIQFNNRQKELLTSKKQLLEKFNRLKALIDVNMSAALVLKDKIKKLNQAHLEVPIVFIDKLKDFQNLVFEYNKIVIKIKEENKLLEKIQGQIKAFQDLIFESKIVNNGLWTSSNDIIFKLIMPKKEFSYITRENEIARIMQLKKVVTKDGRELYQFSKSR